MPENQPPTRASVEELARQVSGLRSAYSKYRWFLIGAGFVIVALIVGFFWLYNTAQTAKETSETITTSQTTNCRNANSTRANQRLVWDFVLDLSGADAGPAEKAALETIRAWIHDVFAERDCSDLTRRYDAPVPPNVKALLEQIEADTDD